MRQERLGGRAGRLELRAAQRLLIGYVVAGLIWSRIVGRDIRRDHGRRQRRHGGWPRRCRRTPHVQLASASCPTTPFDDREGTPPPTRRTGRPAGRGGRGRMRAAARPEDEGRTHFAGRRPADYETNPPTSGDHITEPDELGTARSPTARTSRSRPTSTSSTRSSTVAIKIQYSPDLSEERAAGAQGRLRRVAGRRPPFPNPDMPYDVAATAWTQLIGCKKYEGGRNARRDPRLPRHLPGPGPRGRRDLPRLGLQARLRRAGSS